MDGNLVIKRDHIQHIQKQLMVIYYLFRLFLMMVEIYIGRMQR